MRLVSQWLRRRKGLALWAVLALGLVGCGEKDALEGASKPSEAPASREDERAGSTGSAEAEAPSEDLAGLKADLEAASERIESLRAGGEGSDAALLEELDAERVRISKELAGLEAKAGQDGQVERDRLEKAVAQLEERLDRLVKEDEG